MSAEIQERICDIIAEQLSQDKEEVVPEASFILRHELETRVGA